MLPIMKVTLSLAGSVWLTAIKSFHSMPCCMVYSLCEALILCLFISKFYLPCGKCTGFKLFATFHSWICKPGPIDRRWMAWWLQDLELWLSNCKILAHRSYWGLYCQRISDVVIVLASIICQLWHIVHFGFVRPRDRNFMTVQWYACYDLNNSIS